MSGTELAYGAVSLRASYAMSGADKAYGAGRVEGGRFPLAVDPGSSLRASYAMSSTDVAHSLVSVLRASYGISGTDVAYAVVSGSARAMARALPLYAVPSTDL
eukprot:1095325-Rhodomonas_salina.2